MEKKLEQIKGHLIVSCQALPHEPLHSSFIMGRMARAAAEGGAMGIRANTREDIEAVSYTHLDVYKRQAHKRNRLLPQQHFRHRQNRRIRHPSCLLYTSGRGSL